MKNIWIITIIVILVILFGAFFIKGSGNLSPEKSALSNVLSDGQVQIVKLSVENGKYAMNPSEVKIGIPVRIEADMSKMPGCSKSIVIPAFNVQKSLNEQENIIEFTPNKAGTFNIMCSMNMYKGTFSVLESDGSKSNYVEKASASSTGGSCGAGGSCGCGCGGTK